MISGRAAVTVWEQVTPIVVGAHWRIGKNHSTYTHARTHKDAVSPSVSLTVILRLVCLTLPASPLVPVKHNSIKLSDARFRAHTCHMLFDVKQKSLLWKRGQLFIWKAHRFQNRLMAQSNNDRWSFYYLKHLHESNPLRLVCLFSSFSFSVSKCRPAEWAVAETECVLGLEECCWIEQNWFAFH